jgi:hypothetical protein
MKNTGYFLFLFALSGLFQPALAIDLQPGDIVAPPPNITAITLSYVNSQNNDLFQNGVNTGADPKLESNAVFLRLTHTYTIGSLPAVTYLQTGTGALSADGSLAAFPGSKGMTDSGIVTAIWPYANHATRTYLGVAGYLYLPTGEYSNGKPFNLGSNRYAQALQVGYQRPVTQNMDAAVAVDSTWFGANSACAAACLSNQNLQLTQKPLYTAQAGPIYKINQIFTVAATYVYVTGGETAWNGVERNNTLVTQRYFVSGVAHTRVGRFTVQYGNDITTMNGFMESNRLVLRYAKAI